MANLLRSLGGLRVPIVYGAFKVRKQLPAGLMKRSKRKLLEAEMKDWGVSEFLYGVDEIDLFLRQKGSILSASILSFPHVGAALFDSVRKYASSARLIYDMVDNHGLRLEREAQLTGNVALGDWAERVASIERKLFAEADLVLAVSAEEANTVLSATPEAKVAVVSNAFASEASLAPIGGRENVIFLGNFWHKPNLDGIAWFCREVWPEVVAKAPHSKLVIGGSNMDSDALILGELPQVEVVGWVKDLSSFYAKARISVAPLRFGAGVKGKVGQAMAYGVPVVATSIGAEGMAICNGENAWVIDDPIEMAKVITRLLEDDDMFLQLQREGKALIERTQSLSLMREALRAALCDSLVTAQLEDINSWHV